MSQYTIDIKKVQSNNFGRRKEKFECTIRHKSGKAYNLTKENFKLLLENFVNQLPESDRKAVKEFLDIRFYLTETTTRMFKALEISANKLSESERKAVNEFMDNPVQFL
ncbi:hypothetical protein KR059_006504 [Drosophila kikkawai]|nr:hypothetical protein KR059_006504 [Drosophila kikkawai]